MSGSTGVKVQSTNTKTCLCNSYFLLFPFSPLFRWSCLFSLPSSVMLFEFLFEGEKDSGTRITGIFCVDVNEGRSQLKHPVRAFPWIGATWGDTELPKCNNSLPFISDMKSGHSEEDMIKASSPHWSPTEIYV